MEGLRDDDRSATEDGTTEDEAVGGVSATDGCK